MAGNGKRNDARARAEARVPERGTAESSPAVWPEQDGRLAQLDGHERHPEPAAQVAAPPTFQPPAAAPLAEEPEVGGTIRRLREERRLSLKEVAARSGLTQSFLSQVERDLTSPSVASLRRIAQAFGVPLAALFQGPTTPQDRVVRRAERRQLVHPKRQWRDYLLTPNLTGKLQVILSVIEPGGGSGEEPYAHDSDEECVIVLRGRLRFWVGLDEYLLEEGDSIVFESRIPHRNANPGPGQAEVLWITTPPSY
jgi:transcriptional regulator with XRE-family HTH domain